MKLTTDNTVILSFPEYEHPAETLAQLLDISYARIALHRFPDGESKITLPPVSAHNVILCRSLDAPNNKLVELYLCATQLRRNGVGNIILIAPYLCYMRQDKAFQAGEIVSQSLIGDWLTTLFDAVITVDAHLHRTHSLKDVFPGIAAVNLSASSLIGEYIKRQFEHAFILGPDAESKQWVQSVAAVGGFAWDIAHKQRHNDVNVSIEVPHSAFSRQRVIIVDDMVSTGNTIIEAALILQQQGVSHIGCVVTHGLFANDALQKLANAGIRPVHTTDSITHATNVIALAPLLADALTHL